MEVTCRSSGASACRFLVGSPAVLAAGLANRHRDRIVMMEAIEDAGRHVMHDLERYLNTLATIAAISPLLGLLGTVTGMIRTFRAITVVGEVVLYFEHQGVPNDFVESIAQGWNEYYWTPLEAWLATL